VALDSDLLVDRRRLKRGLYFWRTAAIVIALALVFIAAGRMGPLGGEDYIAHLEITGVILNDRDRIDALQHIAEDERAKALLVSIDSPGGTVVGGEAIYRVLRNVAAKKPVVALMDDTAASGGYMVALGADRIFAHEATVTGSIGVIMQAAEVTELLDKLGIKSIEIKSSPLKAQPSPFEKLTPEARRVTQEVVDDIYDMFVKMTAERRKLTPERARQLADGRIYTGRQAVANGLIDQIGEEADALEWLTMERGIAEGLPVRDVDYTRGFSSWAERLDSLARKTVFSERLTLDGLVAVWHPSLN
jgi:protease-4